MRSPSCSGSRWSHRFFIRIDLTLYCGRFFRAEMRDIFLRPIPLCLVCLSNPRWVCLGPSIRLQRTRDISRGPVSQGRRVGSACRVSRRIAAARTTQALCNPPELWPIRLSHLLPSHTVVAAGAVEQGLCLRAPPDHWRLDRQPWD